MAKTPRQEDKVGRRIGTHGFYRTPGNREAPAGSFRAWARDALKPPVLWHWVISAVLIAGGVWLSDELDSHNDMLKARYRLYQALQRTGQRTVRAHRVTLVAIGDEEFWKGELDRRIPVKRDYLARLVRALDAAEPSVIGIDYTLRSPVADGTLAESPDYGQETDQLIAAVEDVARRRTVVLPSTFDEDGYDERDGSYPLDSAIYSRHTFVAPHVQTGYINLFWDTRKVPITWRIRGRKLPYRSFSLALALADDPKTPFPTEDSLQDQKVIWGTFMPPDAFPTVSASEVLKHPDGQWRQLVRSRIAIIGSFCHSDGFERGPLVDGFETPVGMIPGVIVHANYAEAWVDSRTMRIVGGGLSHLFEALISIAMSFIFVLPISGPRQALAFLSVLGLAIFASIASLFFAVFFDPFLPLGLVCAHGFVEKALGWRIELGRKAKAAREPMERSKQILYRPSESEGM
jgi:CHASE2 domain-containing sensor protein